MFDFNDDQNIIIGQKIRNLQNIFGCLGGPYFIRLEVHLSYIKTTVDSSVMAKTKHMLTMLSIISKTICYVSE